MLQKKKEIRLRQDHLKRQIETEKSYIRNISDFLKNIGERDLNKDLQGNEFSDRSRAELRTDPLIKRGELHTNPSQDRMSEFKDDYIQPGVNNLPKSSTNNAIRYKENYSYDKRKTFSGQKSDYLVSSPVAPIAEDIK